MKKIRKSKDNVILAGVLGGIAEYLDVDPVLMRVIFIVAAFGSMGTFILIYGILAFVMPEEPAKVTRERRRKEANTKFQNIFGNDKRDRKDAEDVVEIDEDDWSDF